MYASIIGFWVIGLTACYLFGFTFQFGAKGIWWGMTTGIAIGAVIVLIRLYWLLNRVDIIKIKQIGSGQPELPPAG